MVDQSVSVLDFMFEDERGNTTNVPATISDSNISGGSSITVQFLNISNADERPPNTKCVNSLSSRNEDWKCLYIGYAMNYL